MGHRRDRHRDICHHGEEVRLRAAVVVKAVVTRVVPGMAATEVPITTILLLLLLPMTRAMQQLVVVVVVVASIRPRGE